MLMTSILTLLSKILHLFGLVRHLQTCRTDFSARFRKRSSHVSVPVQLDEACCMHMTHFTTALLIVHPFSTHRTFL